MITLTREEAQQVLDAVGTAYGTACFEAAKILRARLSAPEPEPVATVWVQAGDIQSQIRPGLPPGTKLYTAPPQREWQGLTDEEVRRIVQGNTDAWCDTPETDGYGVAEMVEAKLKEKNSA